MLVKLLSCEHDGAQNRNQDQYGHNFKRKYIVASKQGAPDLAGRATRPAAELYIAKLGQEAADHKAHYRDERQQQGQTGYLREPRFANGFLGAGVQKHNDEDKQHHDGTGINDDLRHGQKFRSQQQVQDRQRAHHPNQRQGACNRMVLHHEINGTTNRYRGKQEEEYRVHGLLYGLDVPGKSATRRAVNSRFTIATGNTKVQANFINWS